MPSRESVVGAVVLTHTFISWLPNNHGKAQWHSKPCDWNQDSAESISYFRDLRGTEPMLLSLSLVSTLVRHEEGAR